MHCQGLDRFAFSSKFLLPKYEGTSLHPTGKRWSSACAYLHPALSRPNLKAETQAFVSRVLFEGTRAVGVEYYKNGQRHKVS